MTSRNTFQDSLIKYAGYTGATGSSVVPIYPAGVGGYALAGTYAINSLIDNIEIPVPSTARSILVLGKDIDISAGSISIFLVDSTSGGFGVEITPDALTNQQVVLQAFTPTTNGLTWVGSCDIGATNGLTEAKTEMLAGTLLTNIVKVQFQTASGDFSDGDFWVMYQ